MKHDLSHFSSFISFMLDFDSVLDEPVRGELRTIMVLYQMKQKSDDGKQESGSGDGTSDYGSFLQYLIQLNTISGNCLVFDREINENNRNVKLVYVNRTRLVMLKDRIEGKRGWTIPYEVVSKQRSFKNSNEELLAILSSPLHSRLEINGVNNSTNEIAECDYETLDKLIRATSARSVLSKEKARLKTVEKKYFQVCNNVNHNQILANVCFKKNVDHQSITKNSIPGMAHMHHKIDECRNMISQDIYSCSKSKIHFLPIINSHTEVFSGDCSYLDTCHKMKTCRYVHYFTLNPLIEGNDNNSSADENEIQRQCLAHEYTIGECFSENHRKVIPPQWINCDVRYLPFSVLGKFAAIISDPAWDIHMSLPYGTCKDEELLSLPMHELQDEGIILLWVTGRSIQIGRRALLQWGYTISDEVIWVKLNQLKRTIVTGRTGHWLNHSKEHLLVGVKGNPAWLNRKIDTDIVVSATRATSRKPDEIYDIVERLVGVHSRKLEIFGRDHNTRPGWLTIGNQLQGSFIYETEVKTRYQQYLGTKEGP
ncbi:hypothetical protein G9P44_002961 [Scheffersomyces stipitis]|nr:hypothetical protein G9P44_002961 [Scheffersomyces stipitis]